MVEKLKLLSPEQVDKQVARIRKYEMSKSKEGRFTLAKEKFEKKKEETKIKEKLEGKHAIRMTTVYGHKTVQYKSISKPTERARVTFRKTDFLGRVGL